MTTPHVFVVVLRNDARKLECTVCTRPPFSLISNGPCNNKHDREVFYTRSYPWGTMKCIR